MNDYVLVVEHTIAINVTLKAFESKNMSFTPPNITGYKFLISIGGKGVGNTGLVCNSSSNWITNCTNAELTWEKINLFLLYIRS